MRNHLSDISSTRLFTTHVAGRPGAEVSCTPFITLCINYNVRRYGSVCEYLVSAGFTEEEQDKLKAMFLHPEETD